MVKDYCSFVPDYINGFYVGSACKSHDENYYNQIGRKDADKQFLSDLLRLGSGKLFKAKCYLYYFGVRLFGWLFY